MKVKKIQSLRALRRHKSSHLIGNDKTEDLDQNDVTDGTYGQVP